MLIANFKVLNPNSKDPEVAPYQKEYEDGVKELLGRFPSGVVQLQRTGYPKPIPENKGDMLIQPELPSPIIIKLTKTDKNGVFWGYCKGRADIQANGLANVPVTDNSETFEGEIVAFDLKKKPDYAFFILLKSGIVGTLFHVYDPEGDRMKAAEDKNAKLRVQYAIRENLDDERLKMICSAWGIADVSKKHRLLLQEELEDKIFAMEEAKKKDTTNLMLKGVSEFLAEIKDDDITRPKAILQTALDDKRLTFSESNSHFYFDENDICYVPVDRQENKLGFLVAVLRNPEHKDKWQLILKAVVNKEYIEGLDKYGVRWLATQMGLPLNKKPEVLLESLLAEFVQV
jgi:hypothetical protein